MPVFDTTYYSLLRVREQGPEAADWAATDRNWDDISKILKFIEQHTHDGKAALTYPGDSGDPNNPVLPVITSSDTNGYLQPGDTIAARVAYVNSAGLETQATQEQTLALPGASPRPLTPSQSAITAKASTLAGGNYFYALTKVKGSGESAMSDLLPVNVPFDQTYSVTIGFDPITAYTSLVTTGNITNATYTVKSIPTTVNMSPGMKVTGTGIPANTLVVTVDSGTQVTLSNKATATTTGVTLTFSDGTTAINIYRTTGLDQGFQKITQITTTSTTTFEDKNIIDPANVGVQPPSVSTFDATRKVTIDWTAYTHPAAATALRVYVTQEVGLWGSNHLLKEVDLTVGSPDDSVDYLGNEVLEQGAPQNDTRIPSSPPKVNLSTGATGGLVASADSDFNGFLAKNMTLGGSPTVTKVNGMVWHDSTTKQIIARLNATDIVVGTVTGAYSHPTESSGGHIAANIPFKASSGVNAKTIFDWLADSTGNRKQVQTVTQSSASTVDPTSASTSPTMIPEMSITFTPSFSLQRIRLEFTGHFQASAAFSNISIALDLDSVTIDETTRTVTAGSTNANISISVACTIQLSAASHTVRALWWTDTGTIKSVAKRRILLGTEVF